MNTDNQNSQGIDRNTNDNPEQADINRAQQQSGKHEKPADNEKPGEIADTTPLLSEDDLKPDTGEDEAGPEKADIDRAKREKGNG